MNCKPGDLARIVDHPVTRMQGCVDQIIRVTGVERDRDGDLMWSYELPLLVCKCGCGQTMIRASDSLLRPIRDPGDDAQDELLRPLPTDADLVEFTAQLIGIRRELVGA